MKILICALTALTPIVSLAEDSAKQPPRAESTIPGLDADDEFLPVKELLDRLRVFAKDPSRKVKDEEPTFAELLDQIIEDDRELENSIYVLKALPILRQMFDERLSAAVISEDAQDEGVKILRVLLAYNEEPDLVRFEKALKQAFAPKSFEWQDIFELFHNENGNAPKLIALFQKNFPSEPLAKHALRGFNSMLIDGNLKRHPFNNAAGIEQLRKWMADTDDSPFNATVACAFLPDAPRKELLALAKKHADVEVRLEAAWAAGKGGDDEGIEALAVFAKDIKTSTKACAYLDELARKDAIPKEALEPEFTAKAAVSSWFAHPSEMGRHPEELIIVDNRELAWPPTADKRRLWVVKCVFKAQKPEDKEEVHIGVTGSSTFCLFERTSATMTPEQILLIHCQWEMEREEDDEKKVTFEQALEALKKANPGIFDKVAIPEFPKEAKPLPTPAKESEKKE